MDCKPAGYCHLDEMPESHRAAQRIVPVVLSVTGPIRSVVDLGGGDGGWLRVFQQHGAEDVLLIDCPEVAPHLLIDASRLHPCDLSHDLPTPRRFDLAVCLECAEHLPAQRARPIVEWLTKSAEMVLFSAAIPGQHGKGHIHLKFPDYWSSLFAELGYRKHDVLRSKIVGDPAIAWWYRQNMLLFAAQGAKLLALEPDFLPDEFYLVHKDIVHNWQPRNLKQLLRGLGPALAASFRRRFGRREA